MENNYCPHCGKATKDEPESKEEAIKKLMAEMDEDDKKKASKKGKPEKAD